MPAYGADTLHTARIGAAGRSTVHHGSPVVEVSVLRQRIGERGVVITIAHGLAAVGAAIRYGRAVAVVLGAEVLLRPALVADFHRVVCVAVVVLHRGGAAHEDRIGIRDIVHHTGETVEGLLQGCDIGIIPAACGRQLHETAVGEEDGVVADSQHLVFGNRRSEVDFAGSTLVGGEAAHLRAILLDGDGDIVYCRDNRSWNINGAIGILVGGENAQRVATLSDSHCNIVHTGVGFGSEITTQVRGVGQMAVTTAGGDSCQSGLVPDISRVSVIGFIPVRLYLRAAAAASTHGNLPCCGLSTHCLVNVEDSAVCIHGVGKSGGRSVCSVLAIDHIVGKCVVVGISDGVGVHIAAGTGLGNGLDATTILAIGTIRSVRSVSSILSRRTIGHRKCGCSVVAIMDSISIDKAVRVRSSYIRNATTILAIGTIRSVGSVNTVGHRESGGCTVGVRNGIGIHITAGVRLDDGQNAHAIGARTGAGTAARRQGYRVTSGDGKHITHNGEGLGNAHTVLAIQTVGHGEGGSTAIG